MHCEAARAHLLDYLNDETGPVRAWAVRRHLAACAGCAQELAAQRRFTATLRRADLVASLSVPVAFPARRVPLRRALAAVAAVLLVAVLFLLPTLYQGRRNAQNPGAAIAAALARVNTWHFSGWKLIDGRQVPWEVWGRRSPWLYYERVGDTTTWSDGKQRLRVFAPNPALKRPQGLVIKTSGDQVNGDLSFLEDPAYQSLVNSQRAQADFGDGSTKLYAQTTAVARFRRQNFTGMGGVNENKLYTISKRDWLPMTYQLHFDNAKFARDTEYLSVRYDVDMPDAVVNPPSPGGYSVVDFAQPVKEAAQPTSSLAESHGFRVQAEPTAVDKEGNILIVAHGWLGGNRLLRDTTFTLNVSPFGQVLFFAGRGQQKIKYLYASRSSVPPGDNIYLPFLPLDVLQALPDTFALTLTASPEVRVRASDQIDENGGSHPVTTTESLFTTTFHWLLPLPHKPVGNLNTALPSDSAVFHLPSEYDRAEQRRVYYFLGSDYQYIALKQVAPQLVQAGAMNPDGTVGMVSASGAISVNMKMVNAVEAVTKRYPNVFQAAKRKFRARAVSWQQRKLELLPTGGATHEERYENLLKYADDVELLAICYDRAGDKTGRDRTLRRLIRECQSLPQRGGLLRRQAEWSLHTGQFPGDEGYKGPA